MSYDVLMPQLGMTMTEGTVVQWLKNPGDLVEKGEFLFIIQTDKVDIDVESPCSGTFSEILVGLEQIVAVGTVIGRITPSGSVATAESPREVTVPQKAPASAPTEVASSSDSSGSCPVPLVATSAAERKLSTPRARKLAAELHVDISLVPDYEGRGTIVESDVRKFFEESSSKMKRETSAAAESSSAARKATATRMAKAVQTIPHFYLTVLADATKLVELKRRLSTETEKTGVRLSITDLLLKAVALTLKVHAEVNAFWQDGVVLKERINIGFAVQIYDRLVVPVVRDADKLSLHELAKARSTLVMRAREGNLQLGDIGDASGTLSNLGAHGVDNFQAIINPPESFVLATGRIIPRPMVLADGAVVARQSIYLSLSADHRLIDGAVAANFLSTLVSVIDSPELGS